MVEKLSKNGIDEAKRGKFYKKKKYWKVFRYKVKKRINLWRNYFKVGSKKQKEEIDLWRNY
jgi:limonene-1,2-epoxide hydrolase